MEAPREAKRGANKDVEQLTGRTGLMGACCGGVQSSSLLAWPGKRPHASHTPSPALRHQSHLFLKQKQPSEQKGGESMDGG